MASTQEAAALKVLTARVRKAKAEGVAERLVALDVNKALLDGVLSGELLIDVEEGNVTFRDGPRPDSCPSTSRARRHQETARKAPPGGTSGRRCRYSTLRDNFNTQKSVAIQGAFQLKFMRRRYRDFHVSIHAVFSDNLIGNSVNSPPGMANGAKMPYTICIVAWKRALNGEGQAFKQTAIYSLE